MVLAVKPTQRLAAQEGCREIRYCHPLSLRNRNPESRFAGGAEGFEVPVLFAAPDIRERSAFTADFGALIPPKPTKEVFFPRGCQHYL
jgi:hypothetical protein